MTEGDNTPVVAIVISCVLFLDYLVYGAVLPVMAFAPGSSLGEEHLGSLATAYAVGVLGATPLFGWLGQRHGCKTVMLQGITAAAFGTVLFLVAQNFPVLLIARFVQGISAAAVWIAGLSLIAETYRQSRVRMMGWALMGSTGGAILGPLVGAWLLEAGGYQLPFVAILLLTLIAGALCARWLPPRRQAASARAMPVTAFLTERAVLVPAVAVAVAAAGWGILEPLLPARLDRLGEGGAGSLGTIFAVATMAYGASAPLVSWLSDRIGLQQTIGSGILGMAATLPLVSLASGFWSALVLLCTVALFFAMLINPASAALGEAVERRGLTCYPAVYAVYNLAYAIGMVGTSTVAAAVASRIGFAATMLVVSAGLLASFVFAWRTPAETAT